MGECLDGTRVVHCELLIDPATEIKSLFFAFPELFCRANGLYRLHFHLFKLPYVARVKSFYKNLRSPNVEQQHAVASILSESFRIFNPREYPGRLRNFLFPS